MAKKKNLKIPLSKGRKEQLEKDEITEAKSKALAKRYKLKEAMPRQTKKGKWVGMVTGVERRR
jgi:hypothetical protein